MTAHRPLTIAAAQPVTVARDVAANALAHAALVRDADARVIVFPEMSLTGYELDIPPLGPDDPRLSPLIDACAKTGAVALAGAMVDGPSIGVLAIDPAGARVAYRKMWLGNREAGRAVPGKTPEVIDVDGWRLGLAVCKDTGVPEHAAATAALGIDVYAAGVLEHAHDAHIPEQRARRIATEHDVWVVFASFAGATGFGYSAVAGGSGIWSPNGTAVARAGSDVSESITVTIESASVGTTTRASTVAQRPSNVQTSVASMASATARAIASGEAKREMPRAQVRPALSAIEQVTGTVTHASRKSRAADRARPRDRIGP
jgi:predicted amidohydrolase